MRSILDPLLQLRLVGGEALRPLAVEQIDVFEQRKHERGSEVAVSHVDGLEERERRRAELRSAAG